MTIRFLKDMVPMWHIQRIKSGTSHVTFNTPETTKKILHYLIEHPPQMWMTHYLEAKPVKD